MDAFEYLEDLLKERQNSLLDELNHNISFTENELIIAFCQIIQKKYKLKIEKWIPNKPIYPDFMFLGGDRGILAYIKFNTIFNDSQEHSYSLSDTIELVSRAESELDRPIFIVNFICTKESKAFFFETNEEIRDRIYNDANSCNKEAGRYVVDIQCTGGLDEFIELLKDIKKNNVIVH